MSYSSPKFNGDPSVKALASGMATLGRYGDNYMVHAKDGETFVPGEVLDANPKLKSDLFTQMRVMGVNDPERFIVGNELNSINPITGQPEFFFKKIFKAFKKVAKTALPVIAPIVGNMIAPGIGGIIASALVTKMQGGSWGDVAKSAALSYGLGALGSGASSAMAGKGFMSGVGQGLTAPFSAATNLFSGGPQNPLAQGVFGSGGQLFGQSTDLGLGFSGGDVARSEGVGGLLPTYQTDPTMATGFSFSQPQHLQKLNQPAGQVPFREPGWRQAQARFSAEANVDNIRATSQQEAQAIINKQYLSSPGGLSPELQTQAGQDKLADDIFQKNYAAAGGGTSAVNTAPLYKSAGVFPQGPAIQSAGTNTAAGGTTTTTGADGATKSLTGSKMLDSMLTQAAVPAALAAITYFMADDQDELTPEQQRALADPQGEAYNQYLQGKQGNPNFKNTQAGAALLAKAGIVASSDPQTLATATGTSLDQAKAYLGDIYGNSTTAMAAKGGIMTLQGGGEIMGPGSGTSDSIPARLSDGEFVMTADAVRGAGNGSRDMGAARMYDLMSRFERAA